MAEVVTLVVCLFTNLSTNNLGSNEITPYDRSPSTQFDTRQGSGGMQGFGGIQINMVSFFLIFYNNFVMFTNIFNF